MAVDRWTRSGTRCWEARAEARPLDFCLLELHSLLQKTEVKKIIIIICNTNKCLKCYSQERRPKTVLCPPQSAR